MKWIFASTGLGMSALIALLTGQAPVQPAPSEVSIEAVQCQYVGTESDGVHLFQVEAAGRSSGPTNMRLGVVAQGMEIPVPVSCDEWGAQCFRDPSEPGDTSWNGHFEFGTSKLTYQLGLRAMTRQGFLNADHLRVSPQEGLAAVTCAVPTAPDTSLHARR